MKTLHLTTAGVTPGQRRRALRLQLLLRVMTAHEEGEPFRGQPLSEHERQRLRFARPRITRELAAIRGEA